MNFIEEPVDTREEDIKRIYKNWLLFGLDEKKAFHKIDEIFLADVLKEDE